MTKTVVGYFRSRGDADAATESLVHTGVRRDDISVVSRREDEIEAPAIGPVQEVGAQSEAGEKAAIGGMAGAVAGLIAVLIPGIGPLMMVGPIAGFIAGSGIGAAAGGLIGYFKDAGVSEEEAEFYAEGIRRGGTVLAVRAEAAERVEAILREHNASDIRGHAEQWRREGWTKFDPQAEPWPRTRQA